MNAFSLPVASQYVRETVQKVVRVPMNDRAKKAEYMDLAKLILEVYRNKKQPDWSPVGE